MLARVQVVWEWLSTSLWFVPVVMTLFAIAAAAVTTQLHPAPTDLPGAVWWLDAGSAADAARQLSALLTALVTMATLAISITMVVLTLAAGQLGPRLIRNFMADRRTQIILGAFLSSMVYFVCVLRVLRASMTDAEVPHVAVTLATFLFLGSVFGLFFFIHHLARSIVSDAAIAGVGAQLDNEILRQLGPCEEEDTGGEDEAEPDTRFWTPVSLDHGGYVQVVDLDAIGAAACACDAMVALDFRAGHHLLAGGRHAAVSRPDALDKGLRDAIADAIVLGGQRTPVQDLEFSVRQLVEVALRALSPGINDPFTAIAVVDRLGESLALMMRRAPPNRHWRDPDGKVRVTIHVSDFDGVADAAFNQIRQSAGGHADVLIRLLETLGALADQARWPAHRRVLARHVRMVAEAGRRSLAERADLAVLDARRATTERRLGTGWRDDFALASGDANCDIA